MRMNGRNMQILQALRLHLHHITPFFALLSPNHAAVRSTAGSLQANASQLLTVSESRSLHTVHQIRRANFNERQAQAVGVEAGPKWT